MKDNAQYDPLELDTYNYKIDLRGFSGAVRKLLWFAAGGDISILERCPHSERVKYEGLGGVVIATAILAFFSGFYAMYTVFGPREGFALEMQQQAVDLAALIKSLVVAVIWSLVIFNLDRFIITSTGHGDGSADITFKELIQATPRLLMAAIIGLSVSAPLETRVMKTEIEAALNKEQREYVESSKNVINEEINKKKDFLEQQRAEIMSKMKAHNDKIDAKTQEIANKRNEIVIESSNPQRRGVGPITQKREEELSILLIEKQKLEEDPIRQQLEDERKNKLVEIDHLIQLRDSLIEEKRQESLNIDGLSKRIKIAHEISPTVSLILTLLLVVIEVTPIFVKMMLIRGPYDYLVDNQNLMVIAKYGIETRADLSADSIGGTHSIQEIYHQAKTIEKHIVGNLNVEQKLAEEARNIFLSKVKDDMGKNPDNYMSSTNEPS